MFKFIIILLLAGYVRATVYLVPQETYYDDIDDGFYCTILSKGYADSVSGTSARGTPYRRTYTIPSGQRDASVTGFYQLGCDDPILVSVKACDRYYPEINLNIYGQNSDNAAIVRRPPYSDVATVTLSVYCNSAGYL